MLDSRDNTHSHAPANNPSSPKNRVHGPEIGPDVICIGGMNIDRKYILKEPLIPLTSNPVTSTLSVGGVARNIAENLGRLNIPVSLMSVAGLDQDYEFIKEKTESFVNLDHVSLVTHAATCSYVAVLDSAGDMEFALADMSLCDMMDAQWIQSQLKQLKKAQLIVLDLNVTRDLVQTVIDLALKEAIPLVIVPVSGPKMKNLPENLEGVSWLMVNQDESKAYHGPLMAQTTSLTDLAQAWLDRGLQQVLITQGTRPSYYANQEGQAFELQPPRSSKVQDVTGAGDSNAAGIIYGILKGYPPQEAIQLGMTNAYHTVQSTETVRKELNESRLLQEHKQLHRKGK